MKGILSPFWNTLSDFFKNKLADGVLFDIGWRWQIDQDLDGPTRLVSEYSVQKKSNCCLL
jgi:hypothetical protein